MNVRHLVSALGITATLVADAGCSSTDTADADTGDPAGESTTTEDLRSGTRCSSTIVLDNVPPGSQLDGFTFAVCIESNGSAFRAFFSAFDAAHHRRVRLPARFHVELADDGRALANSPEAVTPETPVLLATPWVHHTSSGNYCGVLWNHAQNRGRIEFYQVLSVCKRF